MKEFTELLTIIDRLLGPGGCPWDQKQTLVTTQAPLIEEVYELNEAITLNDNDKIVDELGDLLFNVSFCCRLGEKENRFTTEDVFKNIIEKLIRRHPHVFGETCISNVDEVLTQWEKIKKSEATHQDRKSVIDGIPKGLPSLLRAQKVLKKISKTEFSVDEVGLNSSESRLNNSERQENSGISKQSIGQELIQLIRKAQENNVDTELALTEQVDMLSREFRQWEEKKSF